MSLLQKASNPAAIAVNNAGSGHDTVTDGPFCDDNLCKEAREVMHNDSGALTGLRSRPDYGESDSYTSEMNAANEDDSKGIVAGYSVVVENPSKIASGGEMYISAVEFDPKDATRIEKFSFTADWTRAMTFHKLTAEDIARQLGDPEFKVKARVVLAASYEEMFQAVSQLVPKTEQSVKKEIAWAKQHLKKQDRIVWYLRLYRWALVDKLIDDTPVEQPVQASKTADTAPLVPQQQPQQSPVQPPQQPITTNDRLKKLRAQYEKELRAKGDSTHNLMVMEEFPAIKRNLEHYFSLPVPDIQNKVLTVESYDDVITAFSAAEQEWKEQATKLLKPHDEDKIWKKFADGWAWWWLPRASCTEESKAMGHCGNSPMAGKSGISILSLREPKQHGAQTLWYPHLTFILHGDTDAGTLGEMKGRNNDKPVAKYHPYIIELLKDSRIHGVVGGGYLPEHNFALADLTEQQRKEVAAVNPAVGLTVRDYYDMHGIDEKLETRIKTLLELDDSAHYDGSYGFIIRQWENQDALIADCGDREAKEAFKFVETGVYDQSEPDGTEMADLLDELDNERLVYHAGLALQYHYAPEISEWYWQPDGKTTFDPNDRESVKQLIKDIYEMKVLPTIKATKQKTEEEKRQENLGQSVAPKSADAAYQIPVIREFRWAYLSGGPDQDSIDEILKEQIDHALGETEDSTIEYDGRGSIMQVIESEQAVEMAYNVERGTAGRRGYSSEFKAPYISMPYEWDDWSQDRAVEALQQYLSQPPKRPAMEKQRKLPYRGKGIKVTKLLNPLFKNADAHPIHKDIKGAPFKIGMPVKYVQALEKDEAEELGTTKYLGKTGILEYYEYSCGCGQTYPNDPMIGVRFNDGQLHEFWKEELRKVN